MGPGTNHEGGHVAGAGGAERRAERLRRMESVTDLDIGGLDPEDLLDELVDRVRDLLRADTATVLLLDTEGRWLVATAARGLEEEVWQGTRLPLGQGFAGTVAAERQPVRLERVDATSVLNPILYEKGLRSLLGVPMIVGESLLGVLHVGSLTDRHFTDEDLHILRLAADRAALVSQARTSVTQRAVTAAVQHSLLPPSLPEHPDLDFGARYVPGDRAGIGGDWYDIFRLTDGRLCVVVGDVAGQGLQAALVMGRLRSALRAYALDTEDPGLALSKLDRMAQHFQPGVMATALFAIMSTSSDRFHISVAGHPMPVLRTGGRSTSLDLPIDLPLGVDAAAPRRTTLVEFPHDALLFFHTDGLVERRDRPIGEGLDRLRGAIGTGNAEMVCARVMAAMIGNERPTDDVAVLAVRRRDPATPA